MQSLFKFHMIQILNLSLCKHDVDKQESNNGLVLKSILRGKNQNFLYVWNVMIEENNKNIRD